MLVIILITGCGADIYYHVDVDTKEKSIQIKTLLEVDESDYTYIKGGRKKFVSIIQDKKPDNLEFVVDKDNENKFLFIFTFTSYDDYLSQYKLITGEPSSSTFEIQEYSKESPFQAYQNINFEDDLSHLLNWLKDALTDSGSIDSKHKNSLIHNQEYQFVFDNQKYSPYSYQQEYKRKSIIPITQNNIKIILKKENKIDFYMSLIIEMDKIGELTDHLLSFMKERNVELQYEKIIYNNVSCMKYDIQMDNVDLSLEDSFIALNSVFGEGFSYGQSKGVKKSSFIKDDYQQVLDLQFNFYSLFGLEEIHPIEIFVDVDGVFLEKEQALSQKLEMPFTIQELDNGKVHIHLNTTYTSYHWITFLILFLGIGALIVCLWRFGFKKTYSKIQYLLQTGYQKLDHIINNYLCENELRIERYLIIGQSFFIQIKNINKIHYGYQYEMLSSLYKYIGIAVVGCILQTSIEFKWIGYILLLISIPLIIVCLMRYYTKAVYIKLSSGKEYTFVFEDQNRAIEIYTKLLDVIEKQNEQDEDIETIFMSLENMEGEKNEKS